MSNFGVSFKELTPFLEPFVKTFHPVFVDKRRGLAYNKY